MAKAQLSDIRAAMDKEFVIDGTRVTSLLTFFEEISRSVIPGAPWGRNLDAFDDILSGGSGTPEEGFVLRWRDAELSRSALGYAETVRFLRRKLETCHPSNRQAVRRELSLAVQKSGPTLFDVLVEIIRDHGPGGQQCEDNVRLLLD